MTQTQHTFRLNEIWKRKNKTWGMSMNRTRSLDRFSVHVFSFLALALSLSCSLLSVCLLHQLTHFVNFKYVWDLTCPRAQVKLFNISKTTRRSIVRLGHLFIACNLTNEPRHIQRTHCYSQLAYFTCRPFHSASRIQEYWLSIECVRC